MTCAHLTHPLPSHTVAYGNTRLGLQSNPTTLQDMSLPTAHKRHKSSGSAPSPARMSAHISASQLPVMSGETSAQATTSAIPATPLNPRKRRASNNAGSPGNIITSAPLSTEPAAATAPPVSPGAAPRKKGRTNTPWTPEEEQKLQKMRGESKGWSEIAKSFPTRTEGSVKKHWYKDMHYAEFNEDEVSMLREAIREYETNKWKIIGQKVGKPAKACEQYAREHFGSS